MEIGPLNQAQFNDYLALVDQEIRPAGANTYSWEDFPLILGQDNRAGVFGILENNKVVAGAACLVRQFQTSCGAVPVAGIGCVVTSPEHRGRGFSRDLQSAMITSLAAANVPLAVLWTDQPETYSGRGFRPAGWEFHVDMKDVVPANGFPSGFTCRPFLAEDTAAVSSLYRRHSFRTIRNPGDSTLLYGMPGTKGLVAVGQGDQVVAAVFCGKGADFVGYVCEWSGSHGLVNPLLDQVHGQDLARYVLVPPGGQALAESLARRGAVVTARTTGLWVVAQPDQLARYLQSAGHGSAADPTDPASILGTVGPDGVVVPGAMDLAVWGFDSV